MIVYHNSIVGRRTVNEDKYNVFINLNNETSRRYNKINLLGIYDGHGGGKISKYLEDNILRYFISNKLKYPLTESYINKVFNIIQNDLVKNYNNISYSQGSTCLIVIIYKYNDKKYIHTINLGDCRAIICSNNIPIPLTKDHKPEWYDEKNRIEQLGGKITFDGHDYRINNMSVSRAFGDLDATPYITHIPEINKYKILSNDKFIVLGCDGLWDVLQNFEVVNFVLSFTTMKNNKLKIIDNRVNIAKNLSEYAIKKGTLDNVTVIILFM